MEKTSIARQFVMSGLLIAAAGLLWSNRAVLISAVGAGVSAPSDDRAAPARVGPPVIVATVSEARDDLSFTAIGTGIAQRTVTLRAPADGEITALALSPGQRFEAGDTLVTLEDTDQRLALALAEARLARATAERDRFTALEGSGATATARVEDAQTAYTVARIELDQARADLADRSLRAPFDGVSGLPQVEVGDRIAEDDAIAAFDDRGRILVGFDLPEALLGRISVGQAVSATTPAAEEREFAGEITMIDSRVAPATRTARVRAAIDNSADMLRPGASFALRLDLPGRRYPAVPELALQFSGDGLLAWRVRDGTVEEVPLRLVRRRAGTVIVDGPLRPGDHVVVEGTQRLRPGIAVDVLNSPEAGSS